MMRSVSLQRIVFRARDEIEIAMEPIDRESEQHSRLRLIGRSIEVETLEVEYGSSAS